jgi:hypothetical protein
VRTASVLSCCCMIWVITVKCERVSEREERLTSCALCAVRCAGGSWQRTVDYLYRRRYTLYAADLHGHGRRCVRVHMCLVLLHVNTTYLTCCCTHSHLSTPTRTVPAYVAAYHH